LVKFLHRSLAPEQPLKSMRGAVDGAVEPIRGRSGQQGYILIMLMLFVALLAIGAAAVAPSISQQLRRDREEEMIHRGVQYSRAIRRYVKKFGRYPTRLEELENTNNLRFLRKRYKDPITGQDFKILHIGDVQTLFGAGIAGATPAGGPVPGVPTLGGAATITAQNGVPQPGGTINSTTAIDGQNPSNDNSVPSNGSEDGQTKDAETNSGQIQKGTATTGGRLENRLENRVFGGGPIVGVASTSKAETIREFNHKNHYNQWQFIYDPASDRGGLLNTPAQPPLQVGGGGAAGIVGSAGGINNPNGTPAPSIQPGIQPVQPGMQPMQATQPQPAPQQQ
jgi:type II secretory pathway pseudopilin PulG